MGAVTDRIIAAQEESLGADLSYLRSLADASAGAFTRFALAMPATQYRKRVPIPLWHLARLAATRAQDCGTCVQIVVNAARKDGVRASVLQSALGDTEALTTDECLVTRYGAAIAARTDDRGEAIEAVRVRWDEAFLTELALAVAMVQVFPLLKRGLGQDVACALVDVQA